jgi:hypothetical protein
MQLLQLLPLSCTSVSSEGTVLTRAGRGTAAPLAKFPLVLGRGEARRSSAGVFRAGPGGGALVKQLWANRPTPNRDGRLAAETLLIGWDGRDSAGQLQLYSAQPPAAPDSQPQLGLFELRWIDTSAVDYAWEGVIGNTGPSVGQHVLRSLGRQQDLAISGDFGVRVVGYNEACPSMSMFHRSTPSEQVTLGHADYHRDFKLAATDGEVGYFANNAVLTGPGSFFYTAVTFVVGVDLASNCEHNFTAAGRPQCTMGSGQIPGGTMGSWSWCKPKGSQCAHPGNECANNGTAKGNYNGCNGKAEYWHSVLGYAHDPRKVNDTADGQNPNCNVTGGVKPPACNGTGTNFLQEATGLAVQQAGAGGGNLLFVAHAFLDELRVLDKKTGKSICNVTMDMPRKMSVSKDGKALWVIVSNTSVSKFDVSKLCPAKTTGAWAAAAKAVEAPAVPIFSLPKADLTAPVALSVSPTTGSIAVADKASSQVKYFDGTTGKLVVTLGKKGGYNDGDPTVDEKRLFWPADSNVPVFLAHEADGSIWVADPGNFRTIHLSSSGAFLGDSMYTPASYASTVNTEDPAQVFSNYREFAVDYTKGKALNASWKLVRNWAAGLDDGWTGEHARAFEGFAAVHQTASGATVGLVKMANSSQALVELDRAEGGGSGSLKLIQMLPKGLDANLEDGAVLRYKMDHWSRGVQTVGVQEIWEVPYSLGGWDLESATLATSFDTASNRLASRFSGVHPTFPKTTAGDYIIFDGGTGKNESYNKFPNQGFHLGAVAPGQNQTSMKWQGSPWGFWDIAKTPIQLDGVNCTLHTISNADGRFGANDSAINYAGSYSMVTGHSIVYGFFGEFWKGSEANQFVHFHDSGLFVGQFGTLSQFGSMGLAPRIPGDDGGEFEEFHYALPGEAGNSFAPSLITAPGGQVYFYHNDESKHDGTHRWQLAGADSLALRRGDGTAVSEAALRAAPLKTDEDRVGTAQPTNSTPAKICFDLPGQPVRVTVVAVDPDEPTWIVAHIASGAAFVDGETSGCVFWNGLDDSKWTNTACSISHPSLHSTILVTSLRQA